MDRLMDRGAPERQPLPTPANQIFILVDHKAEQLPSSWKSENALINVEPGWGSGQSELIIQLKN